MDEAIATKQWRGKLKKQSADVEGRAVDERQPECGAHGVGNAQGKWARGELFKTKGRVIWAGFGSWVSCRGDIFDNP